MTRRVLTGKNPSGDVGLWVSKSGQDVFTADKMNMAFSSDLNNPKVVVSGSVTITPALGHRTKDNNAPGIRKTTTIPYGSTISPFPVAFIIASAASWIVPLVGYTTQTASYLNNNWHSPVYEDMAGASASALDTSYGTGIWKAPDAGSGDANAVSQNWSAMAVYPEANSNSLQITTACSSSITVKYLVLDYS
jgi:hypothetical protein